MKELGAYEVRVEIETRRLTTEGMELLVPMVTAVDAGEKCSKGRIDQMIREAIDDWYRERHHEQKEDQEGQGPDVQAAAPEEDRRAAPQAPRVPKPGDTPAKG